MKVCLNDILYAFSYAFDCVVHDLLGVTTQHSNRVAYICLLLGKGFGLNEAQLNDLVTCSLLHDNALSEYIQEEYINGIDVIKDKNRIELGSHCIIGENNIKDFPFNDDVSGVILYHHENSDGSGPFGKTLVDTPIYAQLIHIADIIDTDFDLSYITEKKYEDILKYLNNNRNTQFSDKCVEIFINNISYDEIFKMQNVKIEMLLKKKLPIVYKEYSSEHIISFSNLFANIIDYKSKFTKNHSMGIANKAAIMAKYYGFNEETTTKLYFAGAVHDIGKLVVDRDILEKPDKLTDDEYIHIQNHAYYTYEILRKIKGLEDITSWASLHHEKLDGSGYPFGKKASELGFKERLMGCLDIYQALTEKRPYKDGYTHDKAISILKDMAERNLIDKHIVNDIGLVFSDQFCKDSIIKPYIVDNN